MSQLVVVLFWPWDQHILVAKVTKGFVVFNKGLQPGSNVVH
jgi:hypothetical protein